MIIFDKKSGFSLAESIVSMMIMSLVILLTFATITRKKTVPMNKTTISGVYVCWKDANGDVQGEHYDGQFFNESKSLRKPENPAGLQPENGYDCKFQMDRRADKYYVIAVGSRGDADCNNADCVDGQLQEVAVDTPSSAVNDEMLLHIKLGNTSKGGGGNGGLTTVDFKGTTIAKAMGAVVETSSRIVGGNIKSCKYVGDQIGSLCSPGNKYTIACSVQNSEGSVLKRAGKNPFKSGLIIECKNKDSHVVDQVCAIDPLDMTEYTSGKYIGGYKGSCELKNLINGTTTIKNEVPLKIEEYDSSFKARVNNNTENSPFVHYLKMLPHNIQNGLTDKLLRYYSNVNSKKDGVVLIIW